MNAIKPCKMVPHPFIDKIILANDTDLTGECIRQIVHNHTHRSDGAPAPVQIQVRGPHGGHIGIVKDVSVGYEGKCLMGTIEVSLYLDPGYRVAPVFDLHTKKILKVDIMPPLPPPDPYAR